MNISLLVGSTELHSFQREGFTRGSRTLRNEALRPNPFCDEVRRQMPKWTKSLQCEIAQGSRGHRLNYFTLNL